MRNAFLDLGELLRGLSTQSALMFFQICLPVVPDYSHSVADWTVALRHLLSYEVQKVMLSDLIHRAGRSLRGLAPAEGDQNSTLSRLQETFCELAAVSYWKVAYLLKSCGRSLHLSRQPMWSGWRGMLYTVTISLVLEIQLAPAA